MSRHRMMVFVVTVVTAGVAISGCASIGGGGGASASCAGPVIELEDSAVEPGGAVQLSVDWMWMTCEDTGGASRPAEDVAVTITSSASGDEFLLGRPTPTGPRFTVSGTFALPEHLPPGAAVLSVRSHDGDRAGAELDITVSPQRPS